MAEVKKFVPKPRLTAEEVARSEQEVTRQRRVMNILKTIMPIVSAIITRPGSAASAEQKAEAINHLSSIALKSSRKLMESVAPDLSDKGWANASVFAMCASVVADEWRISGNTEGAQALLDPSFFRAITEGLSDTDEKSLKWMDSSGLIPPILNESDAATRIRLSLLKSSMPLLLDIRQFSFWKDRLGEDKPQKLFCALFDRLSAIAAENANRQADKYGISPEHRISLWQGTISRVFEIAQQEYRAVARKALAELNKAKDAEEKRQIRRAWASGQKGDIVAHVTKTAENMIYLLERVVSDATERMVIDETEKKDPPRSRQ